jgi:predicted enzyme related to lactoylglutathione lyase
VLGLHPLFDAGPSLSFLAAGPVRLMLTTAQGHGAPGQNSVLYFTVTDVDRAWTDAVAAGARAERPPQMTAQLGDQSLRIGFLRDPEGNLIGLMETRGARPTLGLERITPFLHVADLDAAVSFCSTVLGFRAVVRHSNYAYLQREQVPLRLLGEPARPRAEGAARRLTVYVDCADVDAVARDIEAQRAQWPLLETVGPMDTDYGQREYHVRLPDGHWLAFGATIDKNC